MLSTYLAALTLPIFVVRVLSPAIVLLSTLSLVSTRPQVSRPPSPSPITSVVVATHVPRRAIILTLLSLSALTFLLDGLTFVIYAVLDKQWPKYSGIEINSVAGLAAFAGLAALGSWKDIHGLKVWSMWRIKAAIAAAFALDVALVILLGLRIQSTRKCELPSTNLLQYANIAIAQPPHIR